MEKGPQNNLEGIGDRNAFENYFKNQGEFESVILNMFREGILDLNKIELNSLKFVESLIGEDKAERLSSAELKVFVTEAKKVIENKEKLISGAKAHLEEEALRAGFIKDGGYDNNGNKVLTGDIDTYQNHINYEEQEDDND